METFLLYILKSGICLALFYVCFKALFSNDTFFHFNRWLLLAGIAMCLLLPFIHIPTKHISLIQQPVIHLERLLTEEEIQISDTITPTENQMSISGTPETVIPWNWIIAILYLSGSIFCAGTTILSFRKMFSIIRTGKQIRKGKYMIILTSGPIAPFSWGNYIILSEGDYREHPDEIVTHEMMHLHCSHSADLIFMEIVLLFHWFNPAAWLLKRELRDIHEYQADLGVLNLGIDATKYQLLLVKKAVGSSLYTLANSFNHSKIKKRITMMLRKKSNGWARLKLLLLAPVGLTALSVFAHPETELAPVEAPPPVVTEQTNEVPLPTTDKSTNLQKQIQDDYNVYLSFTKKNEAGKEVVDGISIYGVGEQKALEIAEKAIKNGRFKAATRVIVCPHTPKVPMSYLEKMKGLFDANNIKCNITHAEGYDKNGNALPVPPPPPPAPDVYVAFSYKDGKKEEGLLVYERYLKTGEEINKQFNKIYTDNISTVTITTYKWSKEGVQEAVEKILKDKIKYDVDYKVIKK